MPRQLTPKPEDWNRLLEEMPLAAERLKSIILERLLAEAEAKVVQQNGQVPQEQVVK